jgi:hypothetical protein
MLKVKRQTPNPQNYIKKAIKDRAGKNVQK